MVLEKLADQNLKKKKKKALTFSSLHVWKFAQSQDGSLTQIENLKL